MFLNLNGFKVQHAFNLWQPLKMNWATLPLKIQNIFVQLIDRGFKVESTVEQEIIRNKRIFISERRYVIFTFQVIQIEELEQRNTYS